jgi:hypothetical protein
LGYILTTILIPVRGSRPNILHGKVFWSEILKKPHAFKWMANRVKARLANTKAIKKALINLKKQLYVILP